MRPGHPPEIKDAAMREFLRTWRDYSAPSAASREVAKKHGIGRTTLEGWMRQSGQWPVLRAAESLRLQEENRRLRLEAQRHPNTGTNE